MRSNWADLIDGLPALLRDGNVVVAPDYAGLGAEGRHAYLVGRVVAMNVLDSVRAAARFPEAGAGTRFAVWGPSQGGHSSLFTGEEARAYAPELTLVGVVAAAPATDLGLLFDRNIGTTFGNVLAAFVFATWPEAYEAAEASQVITRFGQVIVQHIARYCFLEEKQTLAVLPGAALLRISFVEHEPLTVEPWASLLRENTPGSGLTTAPLLVVQGDADPLVLPEVTEAFVGRLCASGHVVEYRVYPGVGHVAIGPTAGSDAAQWIADRLAGVPARSTCAR
jgi:fermentation-respiration switch protein FrsA (DUF1100 family)